MKSVLLFAGLLAASAMPLSAEAAVPKPTRAAARDWLNVATRTPDGAIVIGNPAAKVKLVEYLSLTCPHCAVMAGEAIDPLQHDYIAKGLVSFEVRHAVRDGYDFMASLLARCQPAGDYLGSLEGLFATQAEWEEKGMNAAQAPGFDGKAPAEKMAFIAHAAGFDAYFAKRGMSSQHFSACMADMAAQKQLGEMANKAWATDKIPGTPAFVINGKMEGSIAHWSELEAKLKAALN